MAATPFVVDPVLTAIAIAYTNAAYIADALCPRSPVSEQEFRYQIFPKEESYSVVDTRVGRMGQPNTITVSGTEAAGSTQDYGLDGPIPAYDLQRDAGKHNIKGRTIERIAEILLLDREQRVSALYENPTSYAPGLTLALSGASRFSDPTSDPLGVMMDALDKPLMRPNTLSMGHDVWTRLRRHPRLIKAVKNDNGEGAITAQQLADLLEVSRVLIGQSRINTARIGKPMALERVWGNAISLTYQNPAASFQAGGMTFALTAQWGSRIAGEYEVAAMGLRGGIVVRAGESVAEMAIAPHAGFLLENVI